MLTIFEELVSVAICSRSNLRSTGLSLSQLKMIIAANFQFKQLERKSLTNSVLRRIRTRDLRENTAKVTGSNPVEALSFSGFFFPVASIEK